MSDELKSRYTLRDSEADFLFKLVADHIKSLEYFIISETTHKQYDRAQKHIAELELAQPLYYKLNIYRRRKVWSEPGSEE